MRQQEFPTPLIVRDKPLPTRIKKIITIPGVRRCGKSSKMEAVANKFLADGLDRRKILWVSFDDERLSRMNAEDFNDIIEAYCEMYPEIDFSEVVAFFDEIQLVENWEYFVLRFYKHYTKNIYISGSNATMLSTELQSALRGWPLEEETFPLSFHEYCIFKGINTESYDERERAKVRTAFRDYNNQGGFPEVVLTDNPMLRTRILQGYFDTMLFKDLVEHYQLTNIEVVKYFLKRIMANITKPTSIRNITNDIRSRGLKTGKDDPYRWAEYATQIFMFIKVLNYSQSLGKTENSLPKYYCIDNGLRDAVLLPQSNDDGKKLENTVLLHLYRERTPVDRIFYYQGQRECDFIVQRAMEVYAAIQVCWDLSDSSTRDREMAGLLEASKVTGCGNLYIITFDHEEEVEVDSKVIHIVPAWKWLLS